MKKAFAVILCSLLLAGCGKDNSANVPSEITLDYTPDDVTYEILRVYAEDCYGEGTAFEMPWEGRPELNVPYNVTFKKGTKSKTVSVTLQDTIAPASTLANPVVTPDGITGLSVNDDYWEPEECRIEIEGVDPELPGDYFGATIRVYDGTGNSTELTGVSIKVGDQIGEPLPVTFLSKGTPAKAEEKDELTAEIKDSEEGEVDSEAVTPEITEEAEVSEGAEEAPAGN